MNEKETIKFLKSYKDKYGLELMIEVYFVYYWVKPDNMKPEK